LISQSGRGGIGSSQEVRKIELAVSTTNKKSRFRIFFILDVFVKNECKIILLNYNEKFPDIKTLNVRETLK